MHGKTEFDPIFGIEGFPSKRGARSQKPVITARDVTKMAAVTHSVTGFPLVLNEIRSVTAFTPIFIPPT